MSKMNNINYSFDFFKINILKSLEYDNKYINKTLITIIVENNKFVAKHNLHNMNAIIKTKDKKINFIELINSFIL